MQKYKEYSVKWETDGEDIDLPEIVKVPMSVELDDIADWLSDEYGWCVNSFADVT